MFASHFAWVEPVLNYIEPVIMTAVVVAMGFGVHAKVSRKNRVEAITTYKELLEVKELEIGELKSQIAELNHKMDIQAEAFQLQLNELKEELKRATVQIAILSNSKGRLELDNGEFKNTIKEIIRTCRQCRDNCELAQRLKNLIA